MAEVILVLLTRPETTNDLLNAAGCLAGIMGNARINVLVAREPVQVPTLTAEAFMYEADIIAQAKEQEQEQLQALRSGFDRWVAGAGETGAQARWIANEGDQGAVAERGSRSDIIVTGRPMDEDRSSRIAFRSALFGTDRPVLMVPPGANTSFGRRVAVAWRDEKRAARAVIPALRCLAAAEQVDVLIGVRQGAQRQEVPRILVEHGIAANLHVIPIGSGSFGQTLLQKAHELSADLLVMGAYAHSPLRELIMGGVTRYMLAHADLPVLMRH